MERVCIFDIEADSLLDEVTTLHCFCYSIYENNKLVETGTIYTPEDIALFFQKLFITNTTLVGHNIVFYDLPVIKKLFNLSFQGKVLDTLAMSWDLYPQRKEHGLEAWGEYYKVPKLQIDDWQNLSIEEYVARCERDVTINSILYGDMMAYYEDLYYPESPARRLAYIHFKLDCALEQYNNPLTVNVPHIKETLYKLTDEIEKRKKELFEVMPKVPVYKTVKKPSKFQTKSGDLTKQAEKWIELLNKEGISLDTDLQEVKYIASYKDPNPSSNAQIKNWLFSLGWTPTIYKITILKDGTTNRVPQLQDADKNLCPNITALSTTHEELEVLEGLFLLIHRQGVLLSFLENLVDGNKVRAEIAGFTNTMRFKHKKPICNLPGVEKPYGKEIRGAIIAKDSNHLFCGSDMTSLEDTTKQHYMYYYDAEYVKQMRVPGFDPHLDIAMLANLLTPEQVEDHKSGKANYKKERKLGKVVNFSGIYGAGPPKIAQTSGLSLELATTLHTTYWERNKAVKQIAKDAHFKSVRNQLWLWNPVAKMWYYLKKTKDIFSTLNQGSGVYCFDTWLYYVRSQGIVVQLQYHDEIGFEFPASQKEQITHKLQLAIKLTNEKLKLNVPLGISIDIANNYGDAH